MKLKFKLSALVMSLVMVSVSFLTISSQSVNASENVNKSESASATEKVKEVSDEKKTACEKKSKYVSDANIDEYIEKMKEKDDVKEYIKVMNDRNERRHIELFLTIMEYAYIGVTFVAAGYYIGYDMLFGICMMSRLLYLLSH